ncbi:MAG: lamin tail domain-containing protein, partial [Thermoplasmata archaeon]
MTIYGSGMTFDSSGSAYLAWSATNKSTQNRGGIYVSRSSDGQGWTTPVNASHGGYTFYSTFPVAYAGPPVIEYLAGEVYVFWAGNRTVWLKHLDPFILHNDLDLYFAVSRDLGRSWIGDDRVDDYPWTGVTSQIAPSVSASRYGIHVIWLDRRLANGGYSVWSASHSLEALLITELVDSPTGEDYVELFSQTHGVRSLQGHRLTIGPFEVPLDSLVSIGPDEHITAGSCLNCDLQVPGLDLPEQGGVVSLYGPSGQLLDEVAYGQMGLVPDPIDYESVSRFWTGERYSDEWTRSLPTPKDYNNGGHFDFGNDLVMTEVHLDEVAPSNSFVELYYRGESSKDLIGFTLVGNVPAPLPSVLLDSNSRSFALTGQEAPTFFQSLNAEGDNLYLYTPSGDLVDAVGWSSPLPIGGSLLRLPKMEGGRLGFDNQSSQKNAWLSLPVATLPKIVLERDNARPVSQGDCARFPLTVKSQLDDWRTIDLFSLELTSGVHVDFLSSDGISPLVDTNANGFVDVGTLAPG